MSNITLIGCTETDLPFLKTLDDHGLAPHVVIGKLNPMRSSNDPNISFVEAPDSTSPILIMGKEKILRWQELKESSKNRPVFLLADSEQERLDIKGENMPVLAMPLDLLVQRLQRELEAWRLADESRKLAEVLLEVGVGVVGVFTHNFPDPDALASVAAIHALCTHLGLECRIYYSGKINRPDNQRLAQYIDLNLRELEPGSQAPVEELDRIVLVDAGMSDLNTPLPDDLIPHVIIDHHSTSREVPGSSVVQIHSEVGATATLLTLHLMHLKVPISRTLATALLYGIRTDTKGFLKQFSPADLRAVAFLTILADLGTIEELEQSSMSSSALDALGQGLSNRTVVKGVSTAFLDGLDDRDVLPQVAEALLTEMGVESSLVCAKMGSDFHLSARSRKHGMELGIAFKRGFGRFGSAGGHSHSAGGKLDPDRLKNEGHLGDEAIKDFIKITFEKLAGKEIQ